MKILGSLISLVKIGSASETLRRFLTEVRKIYNISSLKRELKENEAVLGNKNALIFSTFNEHTTHAQDETNAKTGQT